MYINNNCVGYQVYFVLGIALIKHNAILYHSPKKTLKQLYQTLLNFVRYTYNFNSWGEYRDTIPY